MIRSSQHSIKFSNKQKINNLIDFITEYRRVGNIIVNDIWENGYEKFNVKTDELEFPKYIDYKKFNIKTNLSARSFSSLTVQISSLIRGSVAKRKKMLYTIKNHNPKLLKNLEKNKYKCFKPDFSYANPELSSKCTNIISGNHFDYFVSLKSIGNKYGKINIPLKATKVSNKWKSIGKMLTGISVSETSITLRFEREDTKDKVTEGEIVGGDTGLKDILTLSNGSKTPKQDNHGHSLESILYKMARQKKGSKAFKRSQSHRNNFVNWSINQINFSGVKELRLEKIWNIRFRKNSSRWMSYWTNTLIQDKILRICEEQEVPVILQDSSYRSQRCFSCGIVRKANRKKKVYKCKHCGYEADADYNASLNHSIDLPEIEWKFRKERNNLGNGFYWKPSGITTFAGQEFGVPDSINKR